MNISMMDFLDRTGLDHETLQFWIDEEWLLPEGAPNALAFSELDLARAKLIRDLTRDIGVNVSGVGIVLNLVDQVHGLRKALARVLEFERDQAARRETRSTTGRAPELR